MNAKPLTIAHATDLLPDGGTAFAHAVALAQRTGARLVSLYAQTDADSGRPMPAVGDVTALWSDQRPVQHETVVHDGYDDPVDTLLGALHELGPDLLVSGRHATNAFQRLLRGSVSMGLALNARVPTLLLAIGGDRFVGEDGDLRLRTVVIPVGSKEAGEASLKVLTEIVAKLTEGPLAVHLVACGDADAVDTLTLPESTQIEFYTHHEADTVAHAVTTIADAQDADLIIMASRGQDSVHDVFVGTNTEQVVRHTSRALLCVPIG